MTSATWQVETIDWKGRVDADFGYWSGRLTISVDGQEVFSAGKWREMVTTSGVDQVLVLAGHRLEVGVRVERTSKLTGYRFSLLVDGAPAPGSDMPGQRLRRPSQISWRTRPVFWVSGGWLGLMLAGAPSDLVMGVTAALLPLAIVVSYFTRTRPRVVGAALFLALAFVIGTLSFQFMS
jgi:hypothetical protein